MTYLADRKSKKKKIWNFFIWILFILIFFYFSSFIFNFLSKNVGGVFDPLLSFSTNLKNGISEFFIYFKNKKTLNSENVLLEDLLAKKDLELKEKEILVAENEYLKEVLNRKEEKDNFVLARIIGKRIQSVYDTLLIDLGSNDGILVGDLVFAYGSSPVGKVVEVSSDSSKVLLFSAYSEKNEVFLNDPTLLLEMAGRGGGNFEIVLPRDFVVEEGTKVFLPYLPSYVIAEVRKVISDPRDSFQKILLVSPVNTEHLRFVEIKR